MLLFKIIMISLAGAGIVWSSNSFTVALYSFFMLIVFGLLAVTDYHKKVIPNKLVGSLFVLKIVLGLCYFIQVTGIPKTLLASLNYEHMNIFVFDAIAGFIIGMVIFFIPAFLSKGIGMGDVKLMGAVGFSLGLMGLLYTIVIMGTGVFIYVLLKNKGNIVEILTVKIPLGPFITMGAAIVLITL